MLQSFLSNPWSGLVDMSSPQRPHPTGGVQTPGGASSSSSGGGGGQGPTSLAARLQPFVVDGYVLYNPGGPFQEYLLRVEDALLLHLLKANARPDSLNEYAAAFLATAVSVEEATNKTKSSPVTGLGALRSVGQAAYAGQSPVTTLRLAVRALASHRPADIFELIDTTLMRIAQHQSIMGVEPVRPLGRQALRNHARSLAALERLALRYMPLQDDPLGGVLHLNRLQLPEGIQSAGAQGGVRAAWGLDLQHSGSQQIHGLFVAHPLHSAERPYFCSAQGYAIARERRIISAPVERQEGAGSADEPAEALFVWYIYNPSLASVYFCCSTIEGSPLPPLLGWQQSGLGKLPPPLFCVVDAPPPVDFSGTGAVPSKTLVGTQQGQAQSERPFDTHSFAKVAGRRGGRAHDDRQEPSGADESVGSRPSYSSDGDEMEDGDEEGGGDEGDNEDEDGDDVGDEDGEDDEGGNGSETASEGGESIEMAEMGLLERVAIARRVRRGGSAVTRHVDAIESMPVAGTEGRSTQDGARHKGGPKAAPIVSVPLATAAAEAWAQSDASEGGIAARVLEGDARVQQLLSGCAEVERNLRDRLAKLEAKRVWLSAVEAETLLRGFEDEGVGTVAQEEDGEDAEQQATFLRHWSLESMLHVSRRDAAARAEQERLREEEEREREKISAAAGKISPAVSQKSLASAPASPKGTSRPGTAPGTPARSNHDDSPSPSPRLHDRDRRGLHELLEMTQPCGSGAGTVGGSGGSSGKDGRGWSGRVSVLGVEMWPPTRKTRTLASNGPNSPTSSSSSSSGSGSGAPPEKLCYVIRITLSDIANLQGRGGDKEREKERDRSKPRSAAVPVSLAVAPEETKGGEGSLDECGSDDDDSDIGMGFEGEAIEDEEEKAAEAFLVPTRPRILATAGSLLHPGPNDSPPFAEGREGESSYAAFARDLVRRLAARIGTDSRRVFVVRRDLPTLCTFHAELSLLLATADGAMQPPPFPDPFVIGTAEEEVSHVLLQDNQSRKLRLGQPFLYSSAFRTARGGSASGGEYGLSSVPASVQQGLDASAAQLQSYLEAVFALLESMEDELAEGGPELSTESERDAGSGLDHQPEPAVPALFPVSVPVPIPVPVPIHLATAHPIVLPLSPASEHLSGGSSSSNSEQKDGSAAMAKSVGSVSRRLGRLIGKFLQAADLEDMVDLRLRKEGHHQHQHLKRPQAANASASFGEEGRMREGSEGRREREEERVFSPKRKGKEGQGQGLGPGPLGGIEWQGRAGTLHVGERQIRVQRPSWHPFATSGLLLRVVVNDEQGGKLSLKNEEELLRGQRSKCVGCGEPLISGFFGLERNYQPCRYHGGLFCKRWCHIDAHRVVPHRLLNFWDAVPHRVCAAAALFLDEVWSNPVLHLSAINPLLYEGLPALRQSRALRARLAEQLDCLTERDPCVAEAVVECVLQTLGPHRVYLCVSEELYSMADLLQVQGDLLPALTKMVDSLQRLGRKKYIPGW